MARGLPPRVRGNRVGRVNARSRRGSIPARAGEPSAGPSRSPASGVYPRACGGTASTATQIQGDVGLSPRVRGNLNHARRIGERQGSIPARAGEPTPWRSWATPRRVYPRACGGTMSAPPASAVDTGLSPRVRGNQGDEVSDADEVGSIPARAGEPRSFTMASAEIWVYPRACGGTDRYALIRLIIWGLSPRVRGNHSLGCTSPATQGSIPAHAGEP